MTLFASERERHLWLWTLAVLVAIYSSLGPARMLVDVLRERGLLEVSFLALACLLGLAVLLQWQRTRPGWREIGVMLGVALAYGWTLLRIGNPAERTHLIEYGIVAALLHQALLERRRAGRHVPIPAALTVTVTALLGLLDEGVQAVLPSRFFDWNDVFFNALAGFMVIVARLALAPERGPGWRLWFLWLIAGAIGWGWPMDVGSFGEGPFVTVSPSLPALNIPLYASVATGASVVGILQWVILRRYLPRVVLWVPASLGAAGLGWLLVAAIGPSDGNIGLLVGVTSYGTLAGAIQWLVLRQHVVRAGWWVLASTVGWLMAIPVGDIAGPPGWAVHVAVSGTALVLLLRQQGELNARSRELRQAP